MTVRWLGWERRERAVPWLEPLSWTRMEGLCWTATSDLSKRSLTTGLIGAGSDLRI